MLRSLIRSPLGAIARAGTGEAVGYPYVNSEARALVVAMSVKPNDTRKALIDALITGLKADGLWTILDALYLLAAHDAQAGKLNWKAPGTYTLAESGTGTWTTDRDWAGNGVDGRLTTGAAPASLTNFLQDNASAFVWSRTAAASAANALGLAANANVQLNPRSTVGDVFAHRINDITGANIANASGLGFYVSCRTGATATQGYKNGAAFGSAGAATTTARSANNIVLGGHQATYATTAIAAAGLGAGMDATQNANLYARLNTFMSAIGAA